jgi:hypothetical protein
MELSKYRLLLGDVSRSKILFPKGTPGGGLFMIIFIEDKQPLFEVVQLAGTREYNILLEQMKQNPILAQTLNTPIGKLPKYRFFV